MRIFIRTPLCKKIPLEVESFDTIHHVKGLIWEKQGMHRWEQGLQFDRRELEDSKTLADYYIQSESIIYLVTRRARCEHIDIKTSFNHFTVSILKPDPTINDVKAVIEEEEGIPANEQTLTFSSKELDDGGRTIEDYGIQSGSTLRLVPLRNADDVVDIAAVKERKNAALLKDKGNGNHDEDVSEVPKVGSKRDREDSSSATPGHSERDSSSCGINRVQGMGSFWDEEDLGLAWRRSRPLISPYDTRRFESKSDSTLIQSMANDFVRTLNVTAILENRLKEYQDKLSKAENMVKGLTERNGHLKDSLQKENDSFKKLVQELDVECSTGTSFLQSEVGRRDIATLERQAAKSAVEKFKTSIAMNELVKYRAMSIYEDTVKECQNLLRKSGWVSEDIIQLIDLRDEELQYDYDEEEEEVVEVFQRRVEDEEDEFLVDDDIEHELYII